MSDIELTIQDYRIYCKFPYNQQIISDIKTIPGKSWHPLEKRWSVPLTDNSISALQKLGFNCNSLIKEVLGIRKKGIDNFNSYKILIKDKYPFLFDFQLDAVAKSIVLKKFLNSDECGLGKTLESLVPADYIQKQKEIYKITVVCPKTIKQQWKQEAKKFLDLDFVIVEGDKQERESFYQDGIFDNIIMNYEQIVRDYDKVKRRIDNEFLIVDEASMLKNNETKRYKAFSDLTPKYATYLTGTPIEMKLRDGWVIGNLVNEDWMTKSEFYGNHCLFDTVTEHFGERRVFMGYKNVPIFMERLMEIGIRRKKEDVKQMPGKFFYDRNLEMSKTQIQCCGLVMEKILESVTKNMERDIKEIVLLSMIEDSVELLQKSESRTVQELDLSFLDSITSMSEKSPKLVELESILDEIGNEKIVIFTKFAKMLPLIEEVVKNSGLTYKSGSGDTKDRYELVKEFEKSLDVLIVTDAFAYGVDMPFATSLIHFDLLWNPAKMLQREERIYRITSTKPVKIFKLIMEGLDSYMYDILKQRESGMVKFDLNEQLRKFVLSYER